MDKFSLYYHVLQQSFIISTKLFSRITDSKPKLIIIPYD